MKKKQSRAFVLLAGLGSAAVLLLGSGCSLDSTALEQAHLAPKTYVRAHSSLSSVNESDRSGRSSKPWWDESAPVKVSKTRDFSNYAVAFSSRRASVSNRSLIPLVFQSKRTESQKLTRKKPGQLLQVRTTAYTHNEWDHRRYGRMTARGTRLQYGAVRSAAADWSRFPVGTLFRVVEQPGVLYEVDDYGGALVGTNTIDLYKPTFASMNHWGVRHVNIEVLRWGSFQESMRILGPRNRWPHVRRMINDIALNTEKRRSPADVHQGQQYARIAIAPMMVPQG